jgi:hypothetical protein
MSTPETPPCPMCKGTIAMILDVPKEPVIWFKCAKCGYSWCIDRTDWPFKTLTP